VRVTEEVYFSAAFSVPDFLLQTASRKCGAMKVSVISLRAIHSAPHSTTIVAQR